MAKSEAHLKDIADYAASRGDDVKLHSADPGTNGANVLVTTPTSGKTTWGAAAIDGSGALVTGSEVSLKVPASTTATHYSVWNGGTFLRGDALDSSIAVGSGGAVEVAITPRIRYT